MEKIVYISGASGQIGKSIRSYISSKNIKTIVMSRSVVDLYTNESFLKYHLGDSVEPISGDFKHIFIHLAHTFDNEKEKGLDSNIIALIKIKESFETKKNKKIIFLSSPDIDNENLTGYLSAKRKSEEILNIKNDLIIRPSWIHSLEGGNKMLLKFPNFYIPIPKNNNKLAPIHLSAFSKELFNSIFIEDRTGIFLFLGKEKITFKEYLKKYHSIRSFFLPNILWKILIFCFKKINIKKSFFLAERIEGLMNLRDISDIADGNIHEVIV
jgi:hypothetical protein